MNKARVAEAVRGSLNLFFLSTRVEIWNLDFNSKALVSRP